MKHALILSLAIISFVSLFDAQATPASEEDYIPSELDVYYDESHCYNNEMIQSIGDPTFRDFYFLQYDQDQFNSSMNQCSFFCSGPRDLLLEITCSSIDSASTENAFVVTWDGNGCELYCHTGTTYYFLLPDVHGTVNISYLALPRQGTAAIIIYDINE